MTGESANHPLILVTGATGYIGGRLAPRLLELGYRVRCLVRDPARLQGRPWVRSVEVVTGDMFQTETLAAALDGVHTAYYLVHSMGGGANFDQRDLLAARNFGEAACAAGLERIIYLGGLATASTGLSEHLLSRQKTGEVLRNCGIPVTEFRAGVIVGSGSLSFEMIRYLTERLPVMVTPRWVNTKTQPIGIRDVLAYLTSALTVPESSGCIIEIGGAEVISYGQMMKVYAKARGLKRWMLPVPILSTHLSSYWVTLITPIPASISRPLIEGLHNENIVRDHTAQALFPDVHPADYRTSVDRALAKLQVSEVETTWKDALSTSHKGGLPPVILTTHEGMIIEYRRRLVRAAPEDVYRAFMGLGGERGWLYMNWTWRLRGFIDRLVGGVGLRRGRRDPDDLRVGDALDFWRVEAVEPNRLLCLRAEMKVPGKAWLQYQVEPQPDGRSMLSQTAYFAPKGLSGGIYWYGLYPLHSVIFSGLIDRIAERTISLSQEEM